MFENIPKIDLHIHLDGSLDLNYLREKYNLSDENINDNLIANEKCHDLNDYLKKFNFPISIMQTKDELEINTVKLLKKLKLQNLIYVELRFAPQLHIKKGLTQTEVVDTIVNAMKKVDIKSNLILCYMRGDNNMDLNYETLEVAKKFLGNGVCAVDLAGAEGLYKTSLYEKLFEKTKEAGIPFTIHAGEADGPDSVRDAIKFGAKRIGHGINAIYDPQLIDIIKKQNIFLEVCPTSNIQTCVCSSYKEHPISDLYHMGVKTTINTDNMTVSNTSLNNEYECLVNNTKLDQDDILIMLKNSVEASFLTNSEKEDLLKHICF